tara:strand:- start:3028 stop:3897 length:870 start_codon:yes stop_codon:yes gene_type:complete
MEKNMNQLNYLQQSKMVDSFQLVIVGQDPYPNGANGIAFCKNTFDEFFNAYCCGKDVLFSLGYTKTKIKDNFEDPIQLFNHLLSEGIAFINVSSVLLADKTPVTIAEDKKYNLNFLEKAQKVVVLGKSKATSLFNEIYPEYSIDASLIHPSGLAKKSAAKEWGNVWSESYLGKTFLTNFNSKTEDMDLEKYFDLDLPSFQLYSKGDVEKGVHGIELVNGEYFASHFHLKTKIAKGELKTYLENTSPRELYSKALRDNADFNSWPVVKYSGDNYTIKKYKFSWLMDNFKK